MKKFLASLFILLLLLIGMSGCCAVGDKSASLSIIYGATVVLSLLLLIGYFCLVHKKDRWFIVLFSSVLVVNIGYFCLSISSTLQQALMANRIAYLGSVFLPMSMLLIILNITNTKYRRYFPYILVGISTVVFLIAASPGILDIYYQEVSFEIVDGAATLVKVYGPLHPLYLVFLLGYFAVMVTTIIRASVKKKIYNTAHAILLAVAVFVNIGVWFIEQLTSIDFEMLSISYIISELFLLGIHWLTNENQRLKELVMDAMSVQNFTPVESKTPDEMMLKPDGTVNADRDRFEIFIEGLDKLTQTERLIYEAYIARVTTKEIMASLNIKENTLKFHNKNLYSKLGVSSRKELLEIYKQINAIKANYGEATNVTLK